jgi:hypothetical protein
MPNNSHKIVANHLNKHKKEENLVYNQSSLLSNKYICVLTQLLYFSNTVSANILRY